jgi:serpin B
MKQVAKIKLDEEGTEAAAVTVVVMDTNDVGPDEPEHVINFHANHPFLYVISEQKTGAVFFIGQFTGR